MNTLADIDQLRDVQIRHQAAQHIGLVSRQRTALGLVTLPSGKVGATDLGMNKNTYCSHRFSTGHHPVDGLDVRRFTLSLRDV